jgi:hypothetical protein
MIRPQKLYFLTKYKNNYILCYLCYILCYKILQFKKNEIYIYIKCSADFYCILVLLYVILFYYTLLTYLIDKRATSQEVLFYITRNFDVHFYVIIIM